MVTAEAGTSDVHEEVHRHECGVQIESPQADVCDTVDLPHMLYRQKRSMRLSGAEVGHLLVLAGVATGTCMSNAGQVQIHEASRAHGTCSSEIISTKAKLEHNLGIRNCPIRAARWSALPALGTHEEAGVWRR
jgi:hypothetical protein